MITTVLQIQLIQTVMQVLLYLNVTTFCMNQSRLKEYSCCKIVLKNNTILHIICMYRSPNSTNDNNDLLNQIIEDVSKLKDELLLFGDFNYPNFNREKLCFSYSRTIVGKGGHYPPLFLVKSSFSKVTPLSRNPRCPHLL